jgi:hypothetical protein
LASACFAQTAVQAVLAPESPSLEEQPAQDDVSTTAHIGIIFISSTSRPVP